mmetsp:Transcript_102192/g.288684  ORF Transcript_102192/g.288684 Transcript_102192/m.288684 type:complete len:492 (-) Transcript_102192:73-1548(-)
MSYSDDERVGEIIQMLQVFVFPRRIRMRELFYDFDPLRCGRVTRVQFARGLGNLNYTGGLTEEAMDLVGEYFVEDGPNVEPPQIVNYYKFCDCVEEVYADGNPDPLASATSPGSTMMSTFRPNSIEDEDQVMHVLHRLAALCKTRGVEFKYCYNSFDLPIPNPSRPNPRFGGKVTVAQFLRFFPFPKDFGEREMQILVERYKTKRGDVHYQALHNDISKVMPTEPPPYPQSDLVLRPDHTKWSQAEIHPLDKLRAKVVEKRMRLYEQFQDFDPLRKGFCTVGQVKTVFTILNLGKEINKQDFEKLVYAYMREDGLFCYAEFCRDVDRGFTQPNLEREPLTTVPMPDPTTTAPARRNTMRLTPQRRVKITELEERIATRVRKRRILMKPMFQDMDRAHRGFVTRNQFARAMCALGFELNEIEVGLLAGVYCNFGNHLDFNYIDFCQAVDPCDDDVESAEQQQSAPAHVHVNSEYFDARGRVIPMQNMVAALG